MTITNTSSETESTVSTESPSGQPVAADDTMGDCCYPDDSFQDDAANDEG